MTRNVKEEALKNLSAAIFEAAGLDSTDARIGSEILVGSDMRGVFSHGTRLLPLLVKNIAAGGIDPKAKPNVVREAGPWALVDGKGALGHLAAHCATQLAIEKSRHHGLGLVGVRQGNHFGPAGAYALTCAKNDTIGLAMCNTNVVMAVSGSIERSIGNNPLAFAAPAGNEPPVVVDIAFSIAAGNKLAIAAQEGKSIPEGWSLDPQGNPTTDPLDFLERAAALLPVGGHKGYGLAIMVEVLAGVLTGASLTTDVKSWVAEAQHVSDQGYLFVAINIESFMPIGDFKNRIDVLIQRTRMFRKAAGVKRIYLPGEMEHEHEQLARIHGIPLKSWHIESLRNLGLELGLRDGVLILDSEAAYAT